MATQTTICTAAPETRSWISRAVAGLVLALIATSAPAVQGQINPEDGGDPDGGLPPLSYLDLGFGMAGTTGIPQLSLVGDLTPGSLAVLVMNGALPDSTSYMVAGSSRMDMPLAGGVLVPSMDVILTLPTDSAGSALTGTTWPANIPAGTEFHVQVWVVDAGGPAGLAASNAITCTAQ